MAQLIENPFGQPGRPFGRKTIALGTAIVVLLVLFWAVSPFYQVDAGYIGVLTVFGAPSKDTLEPGLHWKIPFISNIYEVNVTPNTVTTTESAATHDQQNVSTSVAVTWQRLSAGDWAAYAADVSRRPRQQAAQPAEPSRE